MEEGKIPQVKCKKEESITIGNWTFLPSSEFNSTEADLERAQKDLGESEEKKAAGIRKLKEKLNREKFEYRLDDEYLLRYLRWRKFDCDAACQSLQKLYSARRKHAEFFYVPSFLEDFLNTCFGVCLPYADKDESTIYITKMGNWDVRRYSIKDLLAASFILWDLWTMNPRNQIHGLKVVFDVEGFTTTQSLQFLKHMRVILSLLQNMYPWRVRNLIFFNMNSFAAVILNSIKPLLRTKLYERLTIIAGDVNELHQYISPEILPEDYGGRLNKLSSFNPTAFVRENLDYIKYERSFGRPL